MATINANTDKSGKIISYRFRCCVGRDEADKQIWRSTTIPRPDGLTPAKEKKEVDRLADEWEQKQRQQYELEKQGRTRVDKDKMTLDKFITDHWIRKHVHNGKHTPSTISFFTYMGNDIKDYFNDKHPGLKLAQINREDILDYLRWMQTEAKTKQGKPYGATTIQHHFSTLRNILEYATYTDYLTEDPCTKLKPEDRPRRENKDVVFLDSEEAIEFLSYLDSEKEKDYWKTPAKLLYWKTLIYALIYTGVRRGELVGLQWGDFNRKYKYLQVQRNITIDTSKGKEAPPEEKIHIGPTKGKQNREQFLSDDLFDMLVEFKKIQDKEYGTLLPTAYIFCRENNPYLPLYPTEPTRLLKKYIKRHNLPDISPHDLRHTSGSLLVEAGGSEKEVQEHLGHQDAATSSRFYIGVKKKTMKKSENRIQNLLKKKPDADAKAE